MLLTGEKGVWSIGGMLLTGETGVWSIGGMLLTGERGVWSIGGMLLTGETGVWSIGGMLLTGETDRRTGRETCPTVLLSPLHISHELTWDRTRICDVFKEYD